MQVDAPGPSYPDPVSLQQVLETIKDVFEINEVKRSNAEQTIKSWEQNAAPGFLLGLLEIVKETAAIDESVRLLAAVIAKNTVGSSWKKTLGTREWSRVPDDEKAKVRDGALQLLLTDPSDRVAVQLSLLITNIARFDFPGRWENLLTLLTSAASMESAFAAPMKLRALKALRRVLQGLATKRFVIETPKALAAGAQDPQSIMNLSTEFFSMSERIAQERQLFKTRVNDMYTPIQTIFMQHSQAFLTCAPGWELHGIFAKAAAKAYLELLLLAPATDDLHQGTQQALEQMHTICTAVGHNKPLGPLEPQSAELWSQRGGRLYEAVLACAIAFLASPLPFAECVPAFLQLFVEDAIISTDASRLREMRAKRRVLLVRFIAKALLCPFYRPEFIDAPRMGNPEQQAKMAENVKRARKAQEAVNRMLAPDGGWCAALVEALIGKYVALTQQELEEWAVDPEGYLRSVDVESSPDADTPRPIGVGLLLCMLERGGEPVANTLLGLAARLQASGNGNADMVLLREATYRVIGEGYTHLSQHVSFTSWYTSELSPLLHTQASTIQSTSQEVLASVLQARALWLVGVCGSTLPLEAWLDAYRLSVGYMSASDLVVALMAASAVLALSAAVMEDQQTLEQWGAQQRAQLGGARNAPQNTMSTEDELEAQSLRDEQEIMMDEVRHRVQERVGALEGTMSDALGGCFRLLGRLGEVESMVRVLQLVSMLVEVMGNKVQPHLGIISQALPSIWTTAIAHSSSGDTGAVVRLHSALIAVLTHLVTKLRSVATQDDRIMGVVFPLLQFATNLSGAESEVLVEEAFRLWNTTISSLPAITPPLLDLLPNLSRILQRGKDNAAVYPLLESYMFMAQAAALQPLMQPIGASVLRSINNTAQALHNSTEGGKPKALPAEVTQEALATTAIMDVMLQLFPGGDVLQLLMPALKALASLISAPSLPMQGLGAKIVNLLEGALEVLARVWIAHPQLFQPLTESGPQAQSRFADRWLTVASTRFVEEMIGVKTMAVLGRFRRRVASMSMCCLLAADAAPVLLEPHRAVRVVGLLLQAAGEVGPFNADQAELDGMDFKEDLGEDTVLRRRFEFARGDVLRSPTLVEQVHRALYKIAAALGGQQQLLALCNQQSHRLGAEVQAALAAAAGGQQQSPQQQQQQQQQQNDMAS